MFETYDIIYQSKIFTYTNLPEYKFKTGSIIKGGSGYNDYTIVLPKEIDLMMPDYNLYNCEHAYGFTTRGCIKKCSWCIVPEKEGPLVPYMDIEQIIGNKKSVILMDNNILASDHGIKQIEKIKELKIKVDFNQGLDATLIDSEIAKLLSQLKWIRYIRVSCDTPSAIKTIEKTVKILRTNGYKKEIWVYVLAKNFDDTYERIIKLNELNTTPFIQIYRAPDNSFIPTKRLKQLTRYCNRKQLFKSMTFEEYLNSNL